VQLAQANLDIPLAAAKLVCVGLVQLASLLHAIHTRAINPGHSTVSNSRPTRLQFAVGMERGGRTKTSLIWMLAGLGLGVGLAIGLAIVKLQQYDPSVGPVSDVRPSCSVPLIPHSQWTFLRHQNWFESSIRLDTDEYLIVNLRTQRGYGWSAVTEAASTRFEVQTRWVWFHQSWAEDPWQLVYDC
jgi:hypothetical protein